MRNMATYAYPLNFKSVFVDILRELGEMSGIW